MKTKLLVSFVFVFFAMSFLLFKPDVNKEVSSNENSSYTSSPNPGKFLIGAMHTILDDDFNYVHYDSLGLNFWQAYTYTTAEDPVTHQRYPFSLMDTSDRLLTPVSVYAGAVQSDINNIFSHNQTRMLLQRPKIEWLCYGQRSDYQCEAGHLDTALWFYSFQKAGHSGGVDSQDFNYANGNWVRYFRSQNSTNSGSWTDNIGTVISKLKANTEQCRTVGTNPGNIWQFDDQFDWHIKPRIRIDSNVVHSPGNPLVCKIIIINDSGNTILKEVDLRAINFLDGNGNYNGRYLEEYFRFPSGTDLILHGPWGTSNHAFWQARGNRAPANEDNKADIQVYWYGNCDMWIDYVRVDNEVANNLLTSDTSNSTHLLFDNWIKDEVEQIALYKPSGASTPAGYKFYIELTEFNNIPCMSYVNKRLKYYSSLHGADIIDLAVDFHYRYSIHVPFENRSTVMNAEHIKRFWIDSVGFTMFYAENYPYNSLGEDPATSNTIARIPNTLPVKTCGGSGSCGILAYPVSPNDYDDWLQDNMDHKPYYFTVDDPWDYREYMWARGSSRFTLELGALISKDRNIPFILMPQSHSWYFDSVEVHNEPTNEELNLQANLAVTYGAKGLMYFGWNSQNLPGQTKYARGLTEPSGSLRQQNIYEQLKTKKHTMIDLVNRLKNWGPSIMSFDNTNSKSYILRSEYNNLYSDSYFSDVITYKPDYGNNPSCNEDNPNSSVSGTVYECRDKRYLQVATFHNDEPNTKYFIIVNRRCSPFINDSTENNNGGRRYVKIKLDSVSSFSGFNNWNIINVLNDSVIKTFDKNVISIIDLGWYLPGEGKLYKLAPVMQEGGTLVADEVIYAGSFNCNGDVDNGGKNIIIHPNVTINFANGVKWKISGGEFACGVSASESPLPVTFQAQSGADWRGIEISICTSVEIRNSIFSDLTNNTTALSLYSNYEYNISHNIFNLTNLDSVSAIEVDYLMLQGSGCGENCEPEEIYTNGIINNNVFNISSSNIPTVRCSSYGYLTVPIMMDRNTFNSVHGNIAIFLSNIIGGNIKNNQIYNYKTGVNVLSSVSYEDFFNNTIYGDSIGIQINNGFINLGLQAPYYTGGFNRISANNSGANDIKTVAGYFDTDLGLNTFNITNNTTAYHYGGTYRGTVNFGADLSASENCFTLSGSSTTPRENVNCISGLNCSVNFEFNPQVCAINQTDDYLVIDVLGDSTVLDTIWINGEGGGGGISSSKLGNPFNEISEVETESLPNLYNSICIETRKRNFNTVYDKCIDLLDNYIDSTESIDVLSKFYFASLVLDSNGNKISAAKNLYESLILQNGENDDLVKKLFYLVQKCKVALGDYESAMDGFEQIINENPFNYEGLVASWDFSATYLFLNNQGGSGGAVSNYKLQVTNNKRSESHSKIDDEGYLFKDKSKIVNQESEILDDDPKDKYDKKVFTKQDRKVIKENVINLFETSRSKEEKIVKALEEKVKGGEANESEKSELNSKRILSEVIKKRKPNDISEHINFINKDIEKVFGSKNGQSTGEEVSSIPTKYNLSQNYPNPFNPVTKINFDLPQDTKVKLIVYDILGRAVKSIVNSELLTGSYTFEFDGSYFASGIYFYRLETDDFIQSKRMVLVK